MSSDVAQSAKTYAVGLMKLLADAATSSKSPMRRAKAAVAILEYALGRPLLGGRFAHPVPKFYDDENQRLIVAEIEIEARKHALWAIRVLSAFNHIEHAGATVMAARAILQAAEPLDLLLRAKRLDGPPQRLN